MTRLHPSHLRLVVVAGWEGGSPFPLEAVLAAVRGGATLIQLRGKGAAPAEVLAAARSCLPRCRRAGVPLYVNDRADLALAAGADGVHVGPDDLPPGRVRRVAPGLGLGVSARTPERIRAAEEADADYLGVGALRSTSTKPSAPVLGTDGIAAAAAATALPVVAIGGVLPADVPVLRRSRVAGVAVMGAILSAPDPEAAARAFREAWE